MNREQYWKISTLATYAAYVEKHGAVPARCGASTQCLGAAIAFDVENRPLIVHCQLTEGHTSGHTWFADNLRLLDNLPPDAKQVCLANLVGA